MPTIRPQLKITDVWLIRRPNIIRAGITVKGITSIYQPTNAHIISHKTLLKHFKTLRHVSILSDHYQGALFLAKGILYYSQFNSYLQTRFGGSISCCVGMCFGAVARCASYETHTHSQAYSQQHTLTQYDMLPQHHINLLAPELFFFILAHSVYKMWILQEPNMLDLWNKLHFEEEKTQSIYHVKILILIFVE